MKFRVLAVLSVLLLSAPSALGVQRALSPTRGDLAGWLAAAGIELAYLSLAFAVFGDPQRQRLAGRVARTAVLTAITLNVLADYAARVSGGLSGAAAFAASFDWLLLAISILESAPLAGLAYTLATLLHTAEHRDEHMLSSAQHTSSNAQHRDEHMLSSAQHTSSNAQHREEHMLSKCAEDAQHTSSSAQHRDEHMLSNAQQMLNTAEHRDEHMLSSAQYACPQCGAALTQQQYAAAVRYGGCAACRRKK